LRICFNEDDMGSGRGNADGGCQAAGAGADDDDAFAGDLRDGKPRSVNSSRSGAGRSISARLRLQSCMSRRFDWSMIVVAALVLLLGAGGTAGCDKSKPVAAGVPASSGSGAASGAASGTTPGTATLDHPRTATIRPLAQLLPSLTTHLTVDAAHHVYFVQESDDGNDIVFVEGADDLAKPTMLTSSAILAATGGRDNPPASVDNSGHKTLPAAGNVQSLLALADGRLLFFFGATGGRSARSCVGVFDPRSGGISVAADADRLADVSGMGPTLELARGELIANRPGGAANQADAPPWLLLRHSDAWALLRLGKLSATPGPSGDIELALNHLTEAMPAHPTAPTTAMVQVLGHGVDGVLATPSSDLPVMTDDAVHLAPAAQGFTALDLERGALWHIDQSGRASQIASLGGLSKTLSAPAVTEDGSVVLMAADGEVFDRPEDTDADSVTGSGLILTGPVGSTAGAADQFAHLHYPAILRFSSQGKLTNAIGSDMMHGYPSLPLFRVQIASLAANGGPASWVAFDVASGQLVRLNLQP